MFAKPFRQTRPAISLINSPSSRIPNIMTAPLVTVLITTYNYGQFVEEAIESALSKDFPPEKVQIFVSVDGSTNATPLRAKKYVSRSNYFLKQTEGKAS